MSKVVIRAENVSKEYQLGLLSHKTLYRDIQSWWSRVKGKEDPNTSVYEQNKRVNKKGRFRALNNVSFEIKEADVVGIIGSNGAGKSTLLKILSRVTTPTLGEVKIKGKIASLLEVGTGFHPELTGRENIFLNGAILGMSKREILKKFDEIVEFSGVQQFIDTPVKRYSSGMYVRLAFAVAAHLEPDILIVDEVLAVGDAEFQAKCLGKMQNVSKDEGRTVLFVSHNMVAMERLCTSGIFLTQGQVGYQGTIKNTIINYFNNAVKYTAERKWNDVAEAPGNQFVKLMAVRALNEKNELSFEIPVTKAFAIEVEYLVLQENQYDVHIYFQDDSDNTIFMVTDLQDKTYQDKNRNIGLHRSKCFIPANIMTNGVISILVGVCSGSFTTHLIERNIISLNIVDKFEMTGARGAYKREWPKTAVRPLLGWEFNFEKVKS